MLAKAVNLAHFLQRVQYHLATKRRVDTMPFGLCDFKLSLLTVFSDNAFLKLFAARLLLLTQNLVQLSKFHGVVRCKCASSSFGMDLRKFHDYDGHFN